MCSSIGVSASLLDAALKNASDIFWVSASYIYILQIYVHLIQFSKFAQRK
jgi:hypothetical protein